MSQGPGDDEDDDFADQIRRMNTQDLVNFRDSRGGDLTEEEAAEIDRALDERHGD